MVFFGARSFPLTETRFPDFPPANCGSPNRFPGSFPCRVICIHAALHVYVCSHQMNRMKYSRAAGDVIIIINWGRKNKYNTCCEMCLCSSRVISCFCSVSRSFNRNNYKSSNSLTSWRLKLGPCCGLILGNRWVNMWQRHCQYYHHQIHLLWMLLQFYSCDKKK